MALFEPPQLSDIPDISDVSTRALSVTAVETDFVARVYENIAWAYDVVSQGPLSLGTGVGNRVTVSGIDRTRYDELLPVMASQALASGSPANNPRVPTADEIIDLYRRMYA